MLSQCRVCWLHYVHANWSGWLLYCQYVSFIEKLIWLPSLFVCSLVLYVECADNEQSNTFDNVLNYWVLSTLVVCITSSSHSKKSNLNKKLLPAKISITPLVCPSIRNMTQTVSPVLEYATVLTLLEGINDL